MANAHDTAKAWLPDSLQFLAIGLTGLLHKAWTKGYLEGYSDALIGKRLMEHDTPLSLYGFTPDVSDLD